MTTPSWISNIGSFISGGQTQTTVAGGQTTTATATNWGAIVIVAVAVLGAVGVCILIFEETKGAKA